MYETSKYVPPYWLVQGAKIRSRGTNEEFRVKQLHLGAKRSDCRVELSPSDGPAMMLGIMDVEYQFEAV